MPGRKIVPDRDITVENSAGSEGCIIANHCSGVIVRSDEFTGGKTQGYGFENVCIHPQFIMSISDHRDFSTNFFYHVSFNAKHFY